MFSPCIGAASRSASMQYRHGAGGCLNRRWSSVACGPMPEATRRRPRRANPRAARLRARGVEAHRREGARDPRAVRVLGRAVPPAAHRALDDAGRARLRPDARPPAAPRPRGPSPPADRRPSRRPRLARVDPLTGARRRGGRMGVVNHGTWRIAIIVALVAWGSSCSRTASTRPTPRSRHRRGRRRPRPTTAEPPPTTARPRPTPRSRRTHRRRPRRPTAPTSCS